jgi:hypothetical protein
VTAEIEPQPTPDEREVLLRALAQLQDDRGSDAEWWQAGITEAVDGGPHDPGLD